MAAASGAWLHVSPQRALPGMQPDGQGNPGPARGTSYDEVIVYPITSRDSLLADEGSYWCANNAQTGIVPTYGTALVATSPFILIYNPANAPGPSISLTYMALTAIAAGACTTTTGYTAIAAYVDTGNRYTSGGTNLTGNVICPNSSRSLLVTPQVYCGAIVATAASASVRCVSGIRNVRPGVSTTVINVVGDIIYLNFGSTDTPTGNVTVANQNTIGMPMPPIVIPPQSSMLLYVWYPVLTAPSAATYAPDIGGMIR